MNTPDEWNELLRLQAQALGKSSWTRIDNATIKAIQHDALTEAAELARKGNSAVKSDDVYNAILSLMDSKETK